MRLVVQVRLTSENRWARMVREWLLRYARAQSDELMADAYAFEVLDRAHR